MKGAQKLWIAVLLVSCACAQTSADGPAQVQKLEIFRQGQDIGLVVSLSMPVVPQVDTAGVPDRLILILPNTISDARQQRVAVNTNGVRTVRVGLNRSNPPETRIVIELEHASPYSLESDGPRFTVKIRHSTQATARSNVHRSSPPPAASGSLAGIFRRQPKPGPSEQVNTAAGNAAPPSSQLPIYLAETQGSLDTNSNANATGNNSRPTAQKPSVGSLRQGVVFPSAGTPGTGTVPSTVTASATPQSSVRSTTVSPAPQAVTQNGNLTAQLTAPPPAVPNTTMIRPAATQPQTPVVSPPPAGIPPRPAPDPSEASVTAASPVDKQSVPPANAPASVATPNAAPIASQSPSTPNSASPISAGQSVAADKDMPPLALRAVNPDLRTWFKVKYVAQDAAYLDGGRSAGLAEGMKLTVRESTASTTSPNSDPNNAGTIAELEVVSVAENSAVTSVKKVSRELQVGDVAYLSSDDQEALVQRNALSATRAYPAVVSFTEGDTLDDEARDEVPRPPLPSVNRARGRIGFDYIGTAMHGSPGASTSDLGMVVRTDITRLGGTYWNVSGYWRGRFHSTSSTSQPTLQDLINRTYHLNMTYANPQSPWVAGFGRMYLPWASSLDTIDGGYFGRRVAPGATLGIFAGTTPDPTSWSYNPDQKIGGAFVNFEGGSYEDLHYSSTTGAGVSLLQWNVNRPFVFLENTLLYKRYFSIYHSLQADSPAGNQAVTAPGPGIGRSFLTLRFMPISRLELDFNHTYFRDVPTFDPTLIGTGLLDKYLFQGFSGGARVEVWKKIWVYGDWGLSNRSGDTRSSLNQAYGLTWADLPWIHLQADLHYSRFNSSFGDGSYKAFSVSRSLTDNFRLQLLLGQQNFASAFSTNTNAKFLNSNLEVSLGSHYFLQGGLTINRGNSMSYDQWFTTLGYRFDSKQKRNQ